MCCIVLAFAFLAFHIASSLCFFSCHWCSVIAFLVQFKIIIIRIRIIITIITTTIITVHLSLKDSDCEINVDMHRAMRWVAVRTWKKKD